MSLPESNFDTPRGVLVPKPRTTIYTVLLGIAALRHLTKLSITAVGGGVLAVFVTLTLPG